MKGLLKPLRRGLGGAYGVIESEASVPNSCLLGQSAMEGQGRAGMAVLLSLIWAVRGIVGLGVIDIVTRYSLAEKTKAQQRKP